MTQYLFTSESVTEGHPDKVCDRISDAVLDDILSHDPLARVACETCANTGFVACFRRNKHEPLFQCAADCQEDRLTVSDTTKPMDSAPANVPYLSAWMNRVCDIAQGVNLSQEAREGSTDELDSMGAGDQGLMFGHATTESEVLKAGTFMPLPIQLAHGLAMRLTEVRKLGLANGLRPDGKTQVTARYDAGSFDGVETVLVSSQHDDDLEREELRQIVQELIVSQVVPDKLRLPEMKLHVNPTGKFVIGGPQGDSGLTGRKIIVDTYGGTARHGGGAFSGKDPTKVDRMCNILCSICCQEPGCGWRGGKVITSGQLCLWPGKSHEPQRGMFRHRQSVRRSDPFNVDG